MILFNIFPFNLVKTVHVNIQQLYHCLPNHWIFRRKSLYVSNGNFFITKLFICLVFHVWFYILSMFFLLSDNSFIETNDICRLLQTLNTTYLVVSCQYLLVSCHIQSLRLTIYPRPPRAWFEESLPAFSFIAQHCYYYHSMKNKLYSALI